MTFNVGKCKTGLSRRSKKNIFFGLMIAYPILQFIVFYIYVNFNSVLLAFKGYEAEGMVITSTKFVGFDNFKLIFEKMATDDYLRNGFVNSFIAFAVSSVVASTLTLFFSYYIYKQKFASSAFRILLFIPSVISPLVLANMFNSLAETALPKYINDIFGTNVKPLLSDAKTDFPMLLFYNIWISFGTSVIIYNNAMASIDEAVMEAAKLDGATGITEFFRIVFPLIYPTFCTFFVVRIAELFTNQLNVFSFFGSNADYGVNTVGYYLYTNTSTLGISAYPWLSALGLFLTVIAVPATLIVRKLMFKFGPKVS